MQVKFTSTGCSRSLLALLLLSSSKNAVAAAVSAVVAVVAGTAPHGAMSVMPWLTTVSSATDEGTTGEV